MLENRPQKLPEWVRSPVGALGAPHDMKARLRRLKLHTVCESARCPNVGECFRRKTATVMILGEVCTRACAFCAVRHGTPQPHDPDEPRHVAEMVRQLGLRHLVITSVTRDDLADGGAAHFAASVHAAKTCGPGLAVEILTPDFRGDEKSFEIVALSPFDIFNHNLETVRRMQKKIRPAADYGRSLAVLRWMAKRRPDAVCKSGFMVGLGETDEEVGGLLRDIRAQGVRAVTIGQYLRPSMRNVPVDRYVSPDQFKAYETQARDLGFEFVASGPLVRSSYMADRLVRPGATRI